MLDYIFGGLSILNGVAQGLSEFGRMTNETGNSLSSAIEAVTSALISAVSLLGFLCSFLGF